MVNPLDDSDNSGLPKARTGIEGLDEITNGGLPEGRPTLVSGQAGCGKTLLGMEFLVNGAREFDEPGLFVSFEETEEELKDNVDSLGFDLEELSDQDKLALDHIRVVRSEIEETGEYDLEGLFIRLKHEIERIDADRVVLDTIEALFSGFSNKTILRAELRRLFKTLKGLGVTAVITGESGDDSLTRHGLEEYVSDCVIHLAHTESSNVYTRRLRIVKYRGSSHETNEFPFLIDENGFSILPVTSLNLDYKVTQERISSGITELDDMLGGEGYYKGSSILVSGTAGTGKSSLCAHMADSACERGEEVLYLAFEEASDQILRNMRSIGIDLERWVDAGLLHFQAERVSMYGLEGHLAVIHKLVNELEPELVIIDPINAYLTGGKELETKTMLVRLTDFLKQNGITGFFTNLSSADGTSESTEVNISSMMDTWILLRDIEQGNERNRGIYVLKSRGISNSNQIREFLITDDGVKLKDVYVGPSGVLTGSARVIQESKDRTEKQNIEEEIERLEIELERKKEAMEAQMDLLKAQLQTDRMETKKKLEELKTKREQVDLTRQELSQIRNADKQDPQGS